MIDIWVTYKAKTWIEEWLRPDDTGFEFGSGYSTIWLARRTALLVSVDHTQTWYEQVKKLLKAHQISNVSLLFEPNLSLYPSVIDSYEDNSFNFVFVDGRERIECIKHSMSRISAGGGLILDNSERPRYSEAIQLLKNWKRLDFRGPGKGGEWQTSIWIK